MYQDKLERLREQELQRMVKMYWSGRRNVEKNEACSYVDGTSCDELLFDEGEKEELRAIAEERLPMFEEEIPHLIARSNRARNESWPLNLYHAIYGSMLEESGYVLNDRAGDAMLIALEMFPQKIQTCIRLFYKEKLAWDEICDKLDIYATELDEIIHHVIRKLRHPSMFYKIKQYGILVGQDGPLPDPVPTEEQKAFILRLAREKGISKEKANRGFIHNCIRANPDSVLAQADYGVVDKLIEYLQEIL